MSAPISVINGNPPQGLSAAQLQQLNAIASVAKGSGLFEGANGGKGIMGSFVDSVTGQTHYIKMLTHKGERNEALSGKTEQQVLDSLKTEDVTLGTMSASLKDDLRALARQVEKEEEFDKLFNSRKDGFDTLMTRKIVAQAVSLIAKAHNEKAGANGVRFDWKAVAHAGKIGDTTLGNTQLMIARKQLEGIEKGIGKCNEGLKFAYENKEGIVKQIDDLEKVIAKFEDALEPAYKKLESAHSNLSSACTNLKSVRINLKSADINLKSALESAGKTLESVGMKNDKFTDGIKIARTVIVGTAAEIKDLDKEIMDLDKEVADCDKEVKDRYEDFKACVEAVKKVKDCAEEVKVCEKEAKICENALQSAREPVDSKYRELKNDLAKVNSDIDKYVRRRDELTYEKINLKSVIEKVEKGVISVDQLAQELEKTKHPNIMDKADATKEDLNASGVSKKVDWAAKENAYIKNYGSLPGLYSGQDEKPPKVLPQNKELPPDPKMEEAARKRVITALNDKENPLSKQNQPKLALSQIDDLAKALNADEKDREASQKLVQTLESRVNAIKDEIDGHKNAIGEKRTAFGKCEKDIEKGENGSFKNVAALKLQQGKLKEEIAALNSLIIQRDTVLKGVKKDLDGAQKSLDKFNNLPKDKQLVRNAKGVIEAFTKGKLSLNASDKGTVTSMIGALAGCNGTTDVRDTLQLFKDTVNTLANTKEVQELLNTAETAKRDE